MSKMIVIQEMPDDIADKHKRIVKKVNAAGHVFYIYVRQFYDKMLDEIEQAVDNE